MIVSLLGIGAFGKVYLCCKRSGSDEGSLYAIKIVKKSYLTKRKQRIERFKSEKDVLILMRDSPFIARIAYAFETDDSACLVLDYACGGDLYCYLFRADDDNKAFLSEDRVRIIMSEILIGLEELHKNKIVHRDIKLENILIDGDGHIVITDFGLSKVLSPQGKHCRAYSNCGTTEYMAPEMLNGKKFGYDFSVDVWSLGVVFYELLFRFNPFGNEKNSKETEKKILNENVNIEDCSAAARDLLQNLLNKDAEKRLGCGPLGISDIKNHCFFKGINWDDVSKKKTEAPFDAIDFDFPSDINELALSRHSSSYGSLYQNFTYVAPALHSSSLEVMENDTFQENSAVCCQQQLVELISEASLS